MQQSRRFETSFTGASKILEVGSQNINETVRDFFPSAKDYIGIDLGQGIDVDWIVPGELIELPDGWADVVISTECLEHCVAWEQVFLNMIRLVKPGGLFLMTCASFGRATHGTLDSDEYSSPFTLSYYKNLGVDNIAEKIKVHHFFDSHSFEVESTAGDLYFWGLRSNDSFEMLTEHWLEPLDRLARAQGQLAQAASMHGELRSISKQARAEAEQARAEAERIILELHHNQEELGHYLIKSDCDNKKLAWHRSQRE